MQMIGQRHPPMYGKGVALPHRLHRFSQHIVMSGQQIVTVPLQQVDGEEIGAARMPGATIIRHGGSIGVIDIRRNALRLLRPTGL